MFHIGQDNKILFFPTKNQLRVLNENVHLVGKPYACDMYPYTTKRSRLLKDHIKGKHEKQFYHRCDQCSWGTNAKIKLSMHIRAVHEIIKDFRCNECTHNSSKISSMLHVLIYPKKGLTDWILPSGSVLIVN